MFDKLFKARHNPQGTSVRLFSRAYVVTRCLAGEMAEWLKAHAWKACLGETLTWVRIPLSPPHSKALTSLQITSNHEGRGSAKRTILACASAISLVTTSP